MNIILRGYLPDDANMIYVTWTNGARFGGVSRFREIPKNKWDADMSTHIGDAIRSKTIHVACTDVNQSSIVGYCVLKDGFLEWIYVKPEFRLLGVARLLTRGLRNYDETYLTRQGRNILRAKPALFLRDHETSTSNVSRINTNIKSSLSPSGQ